MPAAAARKPVDLAHLARYTGGEAELDAEVLGLFVGHATDTLARLGALLDARDAKAWREATHALKGAAMGIGAFPLAESAASAETIDPVSARTRATRALSELARHFDIVKGFVDAYLAR
jgi:HPt (histidine-containing phosphotransfer) domain-containing protein